MKNYGKSATEDASERKKTVGNIKILFKGNEYLLIGDLSSGGAIATEEQYLNFEMSYAHLTPDGSIMRFHRTIGTRDDIRIMEKSN